MSNYKVVYKGFACVIADSEKEAIEKAQDGDTVFEEQKFTKAIKVDTFNIHL